jgi:DNA-binding MarR family transcriptional regulator
MEMSRKIEVRTPETDRLAGFLCFSIYSANLAYSRVYKPVLEALGLTYPQYITLICLSEQDNQTVKGLSEQMFLEPSTMTPMLQRLEAMGYVTRTRSAEDERVVRISLTATGRKLREKGFSFSDLTRKATGLTDEELPVLQKAIVNLRANLTRAAKAAA